MNWTLSRVAEAATTNAQHIDCVDFSKSSENLSRIVGTAQLTDSRNGQLRNNRNTRMQTLLPGPAEQTPPVEIFSLGQLEILVDGIAVHIEGRGPRRPLELLGMLIAAGPQGTSIGAVADCLWPDADGFDGYRALITTVCRLRRLLGRHEAIHLGAGRIRLDGKVCTVDAWRFERAIGNAGNEEQLRSVLAQYLGPFMEETENAWVVELRERLRKTVSRAVRRTDSALPA